MQNEARFNQEQPDGLRNEFPAGREAAGEGGRKIQPGGREAGEGWRECFFGLGTVSRITQRRAVSGR